jgi:hypothetical protein
MEAEPLGKGSQDLIGVHMFSTGFARHGSCHDFPHRAWKATVHSIISNGAVLCELHEQRLSPIVPIDRNIFVAKVAEPVSRFLISST